MQLKYLASAIVVCLLVIETPLSMAQRGGRGGGGGGRSGGGSQRGGSSGFGGGGSQRGGSSGFGGGGSQRGGSSGFGGGGSQRSGSGGFGGGGTQRTSGGFGGAGDTQRGGGFGGGFGSAGDSQRGGGFGGGLSSQSFSSGTQPNTSSMGPFGRAGAMPSGGQSGGGRFGGMSSRPGAGGAGGPSSGVGVRPGAGAGGSGGVASGIGVRPGAGAGGTGGAASGVGVRPGAGAGGSGGAASGVGVRPGAGAGGAGGPSSGVGIRPGTGADGAASGIGVRPGMGAGFTEAPGGFGIGQMFGTRYMPSNAHAAQGAAVRETTVTNHNYTPEMFERHANAWVPTNVVTSSLYTHPGYSNLAVGLGLNTQPAPYDYGGNVVVQPNAVYVNGDVVGTPQEYANEASELAATGQQAELPADTKWLPLGVFAVVEGDQTSSDDIFELAVDRQGVIRGNYHNTQSNNVETISGAVDKSSQRAAWTIGSDKMPVYEAGVANLTKDQMALLVHTGDGQSRQVSLIRMPQPQQ